jgi:hypothetical protein
MAANFCVSGDFMRRFFWCLLVLGSSCGVSYVSGQNAKPISALPPDGFSFIGSWNCNGAMHETRTHKAAFTGAVVIGGKWLELSEQDMEPVTGYVAKYLIGYDSQQQRLVEFDANNFGAALYTSNEGWQNRVLTMTSMVDETGKSSFAANRFVYTLIGSDTFTVDWQISKTTALNWTTSDHLACKRLQAAGDAAQHN